MNRLEYLAHYGEPEQIIKEVMLALEEKDAEIAALRKRVRILEHAVTCDSCVHIFDERNAAGSVAACKGCEDGNKWEPQQ